MDRMSVKMEIIHMSFARIYRFGCVTFEHHDYLGPLMVRRKSFNERNFKNIKSRQWAAYSKWLRLPGYEREKFRV